MFRVSLRELLGLLACCALALASLKYASETWLAITLGLGMVVFFWALVVAAIDRGPRQAFAIAFVLVMSTYVVIVLNTPSPVFNQSQPASKEFDQWEGRLPTTRLMRYVHQVLDRSEWIDGSTGKVVPSPTQAQIAAGGFSPGVAYREMPPREQFMPIAHVWWGMLFGYLGGRFGRMVYVRRGAKLQPSQGT
jgi:predicted PurR-regulated permease PerM